jgi:hypothetical protein
MSNEVKASTVQNLPQALKKLSLEKFRVEPALRCTDRNVNSNLLRVFLRRLELKIKKGSDIF